MKDTTKWTRVIFMHVPIDIEGRFIQYELWTRSDTKPDIEKCLDRSLETLRMMKAWYEEDAAASTTDELST